MKKTVVLYHADCTDGFTAAWAAHKKLRRSADYIPVFHQMPPPEGLIDKEIYTLDFTYPRKVTERLIADNVRVTSIDHHAIMRDVIVLTRDGVFDNDHSGASLAWTFFNPGQPVPLLVRIVEDWDLNRLILPETLPVFDWLMLSNFEFKAFDKVSRTLESKSGLRRAIRQGSLLRTYRERQVRTIIERDAYEVDFDGYKVLAVTTEIYHHEVGTMLAEGRPFGLTWRAGRDGIHVSMRSKGIVDVAALAAKYGGSGHANAAGFTVPALADLPFKTTHD
ncbi:MAG TPA: hypothetical protein VMU12_00320 [Candidatus Paceibacterota bacterium]|nr:hypothetical protein [Candidatus Paceibacterota bacterium]